ncbi:MAG: hypothetical protein A2W90_22595 [Bacteroidetes bacterium GWF2_42_66]|nr:MAG: hypothetical protein A2W92_22000 [Bacteroidetes bacterium GWA2_42_15]OFY03120.1 MAG: hypothetical protein A2W89_13375 [Bacteroidetes bacterium GWE2_42_39]OFY45228.1 MAG: hypothetical protein A2W90_22595 [Bacteroidetes bacterium GWF2_42_66]HBL74113.1 hypothetical protein [Prolixibacteraceae bacterium]HCR89530.1 hypothetical protein [Prolixibacteraceae bacterium]
MKTLILILFTAILVVPASGQELFKTLVEKYSNKDGFSAVQLSKDMFDLYLKKKSIDEKDPVYTVVDNLENILVITQVKSDEKDDGLKSIQTEIIDYYNKKGMSLFKTEKKTGNDLKVYIEKGANGVSSLGLVNLSDLSLTLIEINGVIDLTSIASLNKAFNIRGLDALRRIDDSGNYLVSPDFSSFQVPDIRFELSEERRREMEGNVKKLQEEMKIHQKEIQIHQKEMSEDQKAMFSKYNRFPIFLSGDAESTIYFINGEKADKEDIRILDPNQIEKIEVVKEKKDDKKVGIIKITTKK